MARVPDDERRSIVYLSLKGYSQRYIGALVNRPLKTVNRIIQAYKYEGRIQDAPRASRPKATTDDEDALIVAAAVRNPFLPAPAIREDLDLDVSDTTVRRRLRTAGLHSRVAAQKPLLTAANKDARRQFAELHEAWTSEEWGRVTFSDELTFSMRQDQRWRVWRLPGTRNDPDNVQGVSASGRSSVNVWGAVSRYGLGPLQRIRGHLSSEQYCNILNNVLLPYASSLFPDGDYLFQQDRSPIHTARAVKEFQAEALQRALEESDTAPTNIREWTQSLQRAHGDTTKAIERTAEVPVIDLSPDVRKVILYTNLAETSITVVDVVYVVDTGLHREQRINPSTGVSLLGTFPTSTASVQQRGGRAGRVRPGESHHLFTQDEFLSWDQFKHPEIQTIDLTRVVLDCKLFYNSHGQAHLPGRRFLFEGATAYGFQNESTGRSSMNVFGHNWVGAEKLRHGGSSAPKLLGSLKLGSQEA
ncbi:uncharacterized protein LOC125944032 [Dermacentor silvarum]|uniref:uncharacterized protein LOC125944032 n=1 Tax=Dermacentor silvarum TaxID=543639 RepID=UPI0021007DF6|nr:uncharacterized protein LOC125944032 [Dermacentor silvarum]